MIEEANPTEILLKQKEAEIKKLTDTISEWKAKLIDYANEMSIKHNAQQNELQGLEAVTCTQ